MHLTGLYDISRCNEGKKKQASHTVFNVLFKLTTSHISTGGLVFTSGHYCYVR